MGENMWQLYAAPALIVAVLLLILEALSLLKNRLDQIKHILLHQAERDASIAEDMGLLRREILKRLIVDSERRGLDEANATFDAHMAEIHSRRPSPPPENP